MGTLSELDINYFKQKYNLDVFIETGIGKGDGIAYAKNFDFNEIISIEIIESQVILMRDVFKNDSRIKILHGETTQILTNILNEINGNIFFWLDAHFPGADIGLSGFADEKNENIRLPLPLELNTIKEYRSGKDVVVFDDLLIYKNNGRDANWCEGIKPIKPFESNDFYINILSDTHDFQEFKNNYGIFTPK